MPKEQTRNKKIAVFDIDGTLFRSSLLIEFNKALMAEGVIPKKAVKRLLPEYYAWRDRKGQYNDYLNRVIEVHASGIKGKREVDVKKVARKVFNHHKDRVYRFSRDELKRLQKNHYTVAISGSPSEVVSLFAKYHGFDESYATVYEIDKTGRYTGQLADRRTIGMKGHILEEVVATRNLTLKGSHAYGDTENDISYLDMVDKPVAVNPSSGLYKVANKEQWKIIVERKDIIYELN